MNSINLAESVFLEMEILFQLLIAIAVGGIVGIEREIRDKPAGFRTNIFICLGTTIFTILSLTIATGNDDTTRIAAGVVGGIGFLGAGTIIRNDSGVQGLTTAATIWTVASLGMAIGSSQYELVVLGTLVVLIVLWLFPLFEHYIDGVWDTRHYRVKCEPVQEHFGRLEEQFRTEGLKIQSHRQLKDREELLCTWIVTGTPTQHDAMMKFLFNDEAVHAFEV